MLVHNEQATALEYLSDLVFGCLIYRPGPERATELAGLMPKGVDLSAAFIREALAGNERFTSLLGSHALAYRARLAAQPVGGAVSTVLAAYGKPMPVPLLVGELQNAEKADNDSIGAVLQTLEATGVVGVVADEFIYLTQWLFKPMPGLETARALYLNELDTDDDLAEVWDACTQDAVGSRSLTDTAAAILEAAKRPLSNKALGALVGEHQGEKYNPAELLRQMLTDDQQRFTALHGPLWLLTSRIGKLNKALSGLCEESRPEPFAADIADLLSKEIEPDKRRELTGDEIEAVTRLVQFCQGPVTVEQVLADVLELTPNQRKYAPAAHAVEALLMTMQSLRRMEPGRYLRSAAVPSWARVAPAPLRVPEWWPVELSASGHLQSEDVLLELSALADGAREAAADPYYDDAGEPYVSPTVEDAPADRITYAVPHHHYRAGTMYVRAADMEFYAGEPALTLINLRHGEGVLLGAWLNKETRLLTGLGPWYQTMLPPSGAELTLVRTDVVGEYRLEYDGETDSRTYIGREALSELEDWRHRLHGHPLSLRGLCLPLLGEKGLPFDQLWAQLNFVRRVSRAQLASVLTFFACFEYGDGARWYGDPARGAEYDEALLEHVVGFAEAQERRQQSRGHR